MKTCGIDLGTTNSCLVVVEEHGHRVITDEHGHSVFPSVVFVGHDGKPSVGYVAKNRIGEIPGPVATIKRKMGSTETVILGGQEKTPAQVSAMILAYLKELAEQQLGAEINRAVVTVPAYFSHIQRQQTDEAARLVGFEEVITLLEPVAAALAYALPSAQERLRVFVYDLGGGTFDATVLEKDPYGGLTVLSFGGDPHLGGDDVDARLARLLQQRLQQKGYRLDLDLDNPEDCSRFQRLKFYAELGKKELSERTQVTLVRQGLFEDKDGDIVDLDLTITRDELEECAADLIQRSINESLATLTKHNIAIQSIDEVIMVGGMSRMPLVQRKLAEAFQHEPKVVDPDLIVARGAAIKAAEVFGEQEIAASGLRLELRYEHRTNKKQTRISGLFDRQVHGYTVYLLSEAEERSQTLSDTNRFMFDNVALMPESDNLFTLSVEDPQATPIIERDLTIVHDGQASSILMSPGSVVTRPIAVYTVDGLEVLFPENTALPHTVKHTFETADQSGQIVVPIWEGMHEVTRLEIKDIPRDLKVGAPVVIEACVESDYHIEASASVPDIKREVSIRFRIEPVNTSHITPEYVHQRLAVLDQEARTAATKCPSKEAIEIFQLRYDLLKEQIEVELSEPEPKRTRLHEKLSELSALIEALPTPDTAIHLEPSFEAFSERLAAIISQAIENDHPKLPTVRPQVDALRARARAAWEQKDPIVWRRINDQLASLASLLEPEISPETKALGMAAWLAVDHVTELRNAARGKYEREIQAIEETATEIFSSIRLNLLDPQRAIGQLLNLYRDQVGPLQRQLGLVSAGEPKVVNPAEMDGRVRKRRDN